MGDEALRPAWCFSSPTTVGIGLGGFGSSNALDAAFERLAITATGTDIVAVAHGFREVEGALRKLADELERDDEWQTWESAAR